MALITAILTGACIGFLPSNSNPAKIFMGDTGALSLGYILAVLSIQGLFKFSAVISFVIPFMMFGLPFGDTFIAFFRRLLSGKDPFKGDRSHLHHKLIDLGFSQKQSVTILYCISAIFGIAAIMFSEERIAAAVMVIIVAIIIALLNWKVFHSDDSTRKMTGFDLAQRDSKNINASPESSDTGLDKTSEKTDAPHETVSAVSSAAPAFVKK
ncbi:Undecaprenyl-phosphate alpha-N-acetylglucosaminyl 1-phosphate transferase [bioreactor metagenome]|uniref:Undecaprenyl-phosphate alpha-N-acetylglucosaminyl 1-phosphate transferase n=1 Tax=bioreactor metagenome TaxID=1076179 RepID=A0A645BEA6_9ZZZZ